MIEDLFDIEYAKECNLKKYLRLGKGEEKSGGRDRVALQADAFEALIGAVYIDKGLKETRKIFEKVVIPIHDNDVIISGITSYFYPWGF